MRTTMILALAATVLVSLARDAGAVPMCPIEDDACLPPEEKVCLSNCTEYDLRQVIDKQNICQGERTIRFNHGGDDVVIDVANNIGENSHVSPSSTAIIGGCGSRTSASGGLSAMCIFASNTTIDGENKVTFRYYGGTDCLNCTAGACPSSFPALFVVKVSRAGNHVQDPVSNITLENFTVQLFPKGILLNGVNDDHQGSGYTVSGVTMNYICEDGINVALGNDVKILNSTLIGHTNPQNDSDPGVRDHHCYNQRKCSDPPASPCNAGETQIGSGSSCTCKGESLCGLGKGVQLDGGTVTVADNRLDALDKPVKVIGGNHKILHNTSSGDPNDPSVCNSYNIGDVPGGTPGTAVLVDNRLTYCRRGIEVEGAATADAQNNIIVDSQTYAFNVGNVSGPASSGGAKLKGSGNLAIWTTGSPTAALNVQDTTALVDFGSGPTFAAGVAVPGVPSVGNNRFCDMRPSPGGLKHVALPAAFTGQVSVGQSCATKDAGATSVFSYDSGVNIAEGRACLPSDCARCPAQPRGACHKPGAGEARLSIRHADDFRQKSAIRWTWTIRGTENSFGTPETGPDGYALCVYDQPSPSDSSNLVAEYPAAGGCSGASCWKSAPGTKTFRYRDAAGGAASWSIRAGDGPRRPRITIGAKTRVSGFMLPGSLAFPGTVTAQLVDVAPGGGCWEASLSHSYETSVTHVFKGGHSDVP